MTDEQWVLRIISEATNRLVGDSQKSSHEQKADELLAEVVPILIAAKALHDAAQTKTVELSMSACIEAISAAAQTSRL